MALIKDLFQSADWKKEKHVPVIDAPAAVRKGETTKITVAVGKEIPHPNTSEHFIGWVEVYFLPQGEKFPCQLARAEFVAHGASTQGPNTSTIYTQPLVTFDFKTEKPGDIIATSYCNIHGLWESAKAITVQ
jgi:superoxide reductase